MPLDYADHLILQLDAAHEWPLASEKHARGLVQEGRAFRKGSRDWLQMLAGWNKDRDYVVDPLARRIAFGYADFLFGEDPTVTVEEEGTQVVLDDIVDVNRLPARLHRAERMVISEGEAWFKLHVNLATAAVPLVTWASRLHVVPLFDGDRPVAAAFITERGRKQEPDAEGNLAEVVYRHAEVHTDKRVVNVLYKGTPEEIGKRVGLGSLPTTAGYAEEWLHGLPMLAGRVVNDLDDDDTIGVSEYEPLRDLLLALNEAMTIASENARLTGQDRVFVAGRFKEADGSFDASMQVFEVEQDNSTLGEGAQTPPIYGIEKRYDAVPLWLHITKLVKTAVSRAGLVPQWIGEDVDGQAESGTAVRLRFLVTTVAAKGKLREWSNTLPHLLHLTLLVAALPVAQGGLGLKVNTDDVPSVDFGDPLPTDASESTSNAAVGVAAQITSRRTAVSDLHPDWTPEQVDDELAEIARDEQGHMPENQPPQDSPLTPA